MNLLVIIMIGIGIGTMVELLLPGHHLAELMLAMLLGVMGAVLSRYIGRVMAWFGPGEAREYLASGMGAIIVLVLYGALFRRNFRRRPH